MSDWKGNPISCLWLFRSSCVEVTLLLLTANAPGWCSSSQSMQPFTLLQSCSPALPLTAGKKSLKEGFSSIWLDFPCCSSSDFSCESGSSCSPEFTFFRHIATPTSYFPHSDHSRAKLYISCCRNFLLKICYFSSSNKCVFGFFFSSNSFISVWKTGQCTELRCI